ncbi:alpha-N-arabinofuranosidase [Dictyobacter arantiisoli]|uniref:non-reducing end alpha-L-arabinofuranosidase n=1 Tax=Dictyobacter arantiisoli TaxID=2014874 RepID=A0A5A5TKT1_9CHLR|nr:alpha-L-arabinofuranosidase C-terminal domain-containing protein [Dictyobacter arantiisoli]GCF11885.1 alpha-N-arabinofuranosidase [Dictyobacter arantiisoli]
MASINIDLARKSGSIDRNIYGGFIEQLGRCVYGGIYEENSPLSDEHGYRKDVMAAVRDLRTPLLRWPGGNFVSGYHWTDGIGPVENRPPQMELAWHSTESNRFGTDEFMDYCRTMNVEPYICVNMGTGTMDEARTWVEYCNGTGNTYWANLRRKNGHEEPYNVKYWGLGNEVYGTWQIGAMTPEDYVKKATEFAKIMKWTDPSIKLVGCGDTGWKDWDDIVIPGLAQYIDYYSLHLYTGSDDYYSNVLAPALADFALESSRAIIDRARYNQKIEHPIYIAYDEWNVWYRKRAAETALEERYNLSDALAVSSFLNSFIRHSDTVKLANLAQMVNVIAPIFTSPEGLFLQTIYHPLRLFAEHMQDIALDIHVESESLPFTQEQDKSPYGFPFASLGPFKILDASATCDASGKTVTIAVVNRHREQDLSTTLKFADNVTIESAYAYEVNGDNPNSENDFEQPNEVSIQEHHLHSGEQDITYTFPAHSLTLLRLQLA